MINNAVIGERLKAYFKSMGFTQAQVANKLGVSQAAVGAILNGRPLGKKAAERWGSALGLNPYWLLTGEGDMLREGGPQNTVNDRFRIIAEKLYGGDITAMAKSTYISRVTINNIIGEQEAPGLGAIKCLAELSSPASINIDWLLTGEGEMLRDDNEANKCGAIPYYDVDFCGGFDLVFNDQTTVPVGFVNLPQYAKADCLANVTGHSMEPLISNGDIIAIHRIEDWPTYLLYGEIYGIVTDEWRTIKRVNRSNDPNKVMLIPANPEYSSQEIPKSIINQVWQVVGSVKKF